MASLVATNPASMSSTEKIGEAMRRALPLVPANARAVITQMLEPAALAIVAATLAVWAGSHFFGVGEIVDVILLAVGVFSIGFSVFEGGAELMEFAEGALGAASEADLDAAAGHFARAVTLLGISAVQAALTKGPAGAVARRGIPRTTPRIAVGEPPPAGNVLRLSRPSSIPGGALGITDEYGSIIVSRSQSLTEQRITLYHELVHRYFSPRTGPLRKLRAELSISGYVKSAFLKYLEEGLAEGYAQLRVNGLAAGLRAYRFPIENGYVTVSELIGEGVLVGTISLGGALFYVSISDRRWSGP